MGLLNCLGFETGSISSTLANTEFDAVSVGASATFQASGSGITGRANSRYALQAATGASSVVSYGEIDWGSDEATTYCHVMVMFTAVPSAVTSFFSLYDSTPAAIIDLRVNASGVFCLYNYGDATLYTATNANGECTVVANLWYRIELELVNHASAGTIDMKINGILEAGVSGLTGKNTLPGGNSRRYRVGVTVAQANAGTRYIDDVIIRNDNWVGMGYVGRINTKGSDAAAWTVVDGGKASWECMRDFPWAGSEVEYIKSSTASQEERYSLGPLAQAIHSATILGVIPVIRHRRSVAGSAAGVNVNLRSSGTDGAQTLCDSGDASYKTIRGGVLTTDPATAAAWTLAAINAMILRLVHDAGANEARVISALVYVAFVGGQEAITKAWASKNSPRTVGPVKTSRIPRASATPWERYLKRGRNQKTF